MYWDFKQDQMYRHSRRRIQKLENDKDLLVKNEHEIGTCPVCLNELSYPEVEDAAGRGRTNAGAEEHTFLDFIRARSQKIASSASNYLKPVTNWVSESFTYVFPATARWLNPPQRRAYRPIATDAGDVEFSAAFDHAQQASETISQYSRDAFALRCGHIFCEKCIKTWLEKHDTCPVCKNTVIERRSREVARDTRDVRALMDTIIQENDGQRFVTRSELRHYLRRQQRDLYWQDLTFRSMRLNHYYPRYVTRRMAQEFHTEPRSAYLTRHDHYVREQRRFEAKQQSRKPTHRGNRRGFGGGTASGGGGGGW